MSRLFVPVSVFVAVALAYSQQFTTPANAQGSPEWQQRVRYIIDVNLDTSNHGFHGSETVVYYNNSPDTLDHVYFHLYFNAFNPRSMMASRNRELPDPDPRIVPRIWQLRPEEVGFLEVETISQDGGDPLETRRNDTVLRVALERRVPPGDSTALALNFRGQVPLQTRRSGRDNREGIDYSMSQWYPKIAAYDSRGWHADPYVGREFYGPFGRFDVSITLPSHYVVGGTGVVTNGDEVGHGYQSDSTRVFEYDPSRNSTWRFAASDVHDFAWCADPDYVHDRWMSDDIEYHLLYQPEVGSNWQSLKQFAPALIEYMSARVGPYPWPQFTVAQAGDGGMEYPMMTFITGRRSAGSVMGVTAHEAAHEWFYGVLGSNEADYSWMDEGLATFLSTESMAHLRGGTPSHRGNYISYIRAGEFGIRDRPNTPADWYETNTSFSVGTYTSGAILIDMLGYVISDSLRDRFLQEYYREFRFRHPVPGDVEKVSETVSGLILDWYFEQFTNTVRDVDYAVDGFRSRRSDDGWSVEITLRNNGSVVLPADVRIDLENGEVVWVNVPLGIMQGAKPVPADWIVAPPWSWTDPVYGFALTTQSRPKSVQIDPLGRTPDTNRLNNSSRLPVEARFLQPVSSDWFNYRVGFRPSVHYAYLFGPGVGLRAEGQYFFDRHRIKASIVLWPQVVVTGGDEPRAGAVGRDAGPAGGFDYFLSYKHPISFGRPGSNVSVQSQKQLGVAENRIDVSTRIDRQSLFSRSRRWVRVHAVHLRAARDRVFELDEFPWFLGEHLISTGVSIRAEGEKGHVEIGGETGSSFRSQQVCSSPELCAGEIRQSATKAYLSGSWQRPIGGLAFRASGRAVLGVDRLAFHERFRLGAKSVADAWRSVTARETVAAFRNARSEAHVVALGEPGPVAYLLSDDAVGGTPVGSKGMAASVSLGSRPGWASNEWLQPLSIAAFLGAGTTWGSSSLGSELTADNIVLDGGIEVRYDVSGVKRLSRWTQQSDFLEGLNVAVRMPLWASDPDLIEAGSDAFGFRWLLGIVIDN